MRPLVIRSRGQHLFERGDRFRVLEAQGFAVHQLHDEVVGADVVDSASAEQAENPIRSQLRFRTEGATAFVERGRVHGSCIRATVRTA
jgi:hypothetical protein